MIYSLEQSKNKEYDFLLNGALYFSIVGEDEKGDLQIKYSCEYLTNQESSELIEGLVNSTLKSYLSKHETNL